MATLIPPRALAWALVTAGLAVAGGAVFTWLGLPAGWLMGAMVAVGGAALAGLPMGLPNILREIAFLLLGISIGSSVTPGILTELRAWPGSIALLALSIVATISVSSLYLQKVQGWDRMTARFASIPGAFSAITVIAADSKADLPRVILAQGLRVFTLVVLMPPVLALSSGGRPPGAAAADVIRFEVNSPAEGLAVFLASAALALLLNRLRVPAGTLLGAMIVSASLHATGAVHGRFPPQLVILGFIATGAVIGARFRGTTLQTVLRTIPGAAVSILLAMIVSALFAWLGTRLLGLPFGQLWLALAPGGVEAMAAMALVLNLEPAFVGAHHILRILGLTLIAPFWLRGRGPG